MPGSTCTAVSIWLGSGSVMPAGVKKLLFLGSSCIYPKFAPQPMKEEYLLDGKLEPTNEPYAVAKIAGIEMCQAYNRQYGTCFISAMPTNLYGPGDNFDLLDSHVIPAMMRKFHLARVAGAPEVVVWGSGAPVRDFVYAGDVAETIPFFIDRYDSSEPVNLSSGTTTSIRELAETIGKLTGYRGEILYDDTKPDGQMVKIFNVSRMNSLGLSCPTLLEHGLKKTIAWFEKNYEDRGDGIRLSQAALA